MSARERALWLVGAAVLLASVIVAAFVFGGASNHADGGRPPSGLPSFDGLLIEVRNDRLRLRLEGASPGRDEIDFAVRPEDRAALDIAHLRMHVRDRVPTRVYYELEAGQFLARRVEDLPGLR